MCDSTKNNRSLPELCECGEMHSKKNHECFICGKKGFDHSEEQCSLFDPDVDYTMLKYIKETEYYKKNIDSCCMICRERENVCRCGYSY